MMVVSPQVAGLAPIIGREAELDNLCAEFLAANTVPVVRVLTGMGGVGKTSLARAYAQRHVADYGVVWWVRAEDAGAIDAEFRALLEILLPPGEAQQVANARTKAFDLLARRDDPWLLVLDNVPDAEAAHGLLPPAGNGHVLITTRATGWPNPTTIQPLNTEAAVELLAALPGDTSAEALAIELGGLPLALTQAAGFVRASGIDLATYVKLYRDRSAELHNEGRPADYPDTVATTWLMAMDRLTPRAKGILNLLAFYAPDAIPVHQLFGSMDELVRHRAIGELRSYSLVTATGSNGVTVHRLVQAVTRDQLDTDRHEWANSAHKLIMAAMPIQPATAISLATWNALHTHAHALLEHLPPNHPDMLITRHELAHWAGEAGDGAQARDLLAELLPICQQVLGIEHPKTLTVWHNLAFWTGQAGDAARAGELLAELLPIRERILGTDDRATLAVRHNLARFIGQAKDPMRARELFAELVPIYERTLGAEHAETLRTRHELAYWTGQAGDAAQARDLFANLVTTHEQAMGAEHRETLLARSSLAFWTWQSGDVADARIQYTELLPTMERTLGVGHPDTTTVRLNARAELAGAVKEVGPGGGGEG